MKTIELIILILVLLTLGMCLFKPRRETYGEVVREMVDHSSVDPQGLVMVEQGMPAPTGSPSFEGIPPFEGMLGDNIS